MVAALWYLSLLVANRQGMQGYQGILGTTSLKAFSRTAYYQQLEWNFNINLSLSRGLLRRSEKPALAFCVLFLYWLRHEISREFKSTNQSIE